MPNWISVPEHVINTDAVQAVNRRADGRIELDFGGWEGNEYMFSGAIAEALWNYFITRAIRLTLMDDQEAQAENH
jgi:hypothetical protein